MLRVARVLASASAQSMRLARSSASRLVASQAYEPSRRKGALVLEDGSVFNGYSFGKDVAVAGEAVFCTGMVGYPESLTDPSYRGQILTMTQPLMGNYGVPGDEIDEWGVRKFFESDRIQASALIVQDYSTEPSHWNCKRTLSSWLQEYEIPALYGIDTRELTKRIRERGVMLGKIVFDNDIPFEDINQRNLVAEVSLKQPRVFNPKGELKILAYDCGVKYHLIRSLCERGAQVKLVPWDYDLTNESFDGLFISNGPGDPSLCDKTVTAIQAAMAMNKPIFGVCMGNQLLARSVGVPTYKLKYGNRGHNQPAIDMFSNRCYITSQNHGFAVDHTKLPRDWRVYFMNANDYSNEGIMHTEKPWFSVQFHPEARAGPYDTQFLFDKFLGKVREYKDHKRAVGFFKTPGQDVRKVLVLGSGGLSIGQAGEFDYSGSQAIKAMQQEGIECIVINPNIATIQTGKGLADRVYFLPVNAQFVEDVIAKERPDGILLSFGGQTALNTGVQLYESKVLEKYGVKVLGTPVETIIDTEDRGRFNARLMEIGQKLAVAEACDTVEHAIAAADRIGFPVMMRCAFALGGLGSGICKTPAELKRMAEDAFAANIPQVLVEKSLKGWKECEYEVVRDAFGNCITVCNMENFDPMGIHTGESIVVAPSQTLTNEEYMMLRQAAIDTVSHLGIIGECNIQYALDPYSLEYTVIEVNPRLSRSSALASKATGYPLAYVAAKLSLGKRLPDLTNAVTQSTTACFEPSLDYIVVKMPRWDLKKFTQGDADEQLKLKRIGSSMKSVGEVMSVGRNFEEAMQKAIRMVNTGNSGFAPMEFGKMSVAQITMELEYPTDRRVFAISQALRDKQNFSVDKVWELTKIDKWFLHKLQRVTDVELELRTYAGARVAPAKKVLSGDEERDLVARELAAYESRAKKVSAALMRTAKEVGFSDRQIGDFVGMSELAMRRVRKSLGVLPVVKQIDTLAAEFPARTNYLYVTYNGRDHDIKFDDHGFIVLGSGVYRIGSSVEFDYCSVNAVRTLRKLGKKTVLVNFNPETVSTDYDEADRLYFDELSLERVLDIYELEGASGVLGSFGGQIPQNLAMPMKKAGLNVLGTDPERVEEAEDRSAFSALMDRIGVQQPRWAELKDIPAAKAFAAEVGYPVLVRPSFVLSGAAMKVVWTNEQLEECLGAAAAETDYSVVMSKFHYGFNEVEMDGVAKDGKVMCYAISEHVEFGGVHSGDATMVLPVKNLDTKTSDNVRALGERIAKALEITGPFNIQFLTSGAANIKVIECNLRASRSVPFVSKVLGVDFVELATKAMLGLDVPVLGQPHVTHVGVKAPQFSWQRLKGADPVLGVEMASTGEVACFGETKEEAWLKAFISSRNELPKFKRAFVSTGDDASFDEHAKALQRMGFAIFTDERTAKHFTSIGVKHTALAPASTKAVSKQRVDEYLREPSNRMDIVIQVPEQFEQPRSDNYVVRRLAADYGMPLLTDMNLAKLYVTSIEKVTSFPIKAWDEYI